MWHRKLPKTNILENTWSRKRNVRVNGRTKCTRSQAAVPEEKRKVNGSVNGGSAQNAGPGRKTEEKRKGNRKWNRLSKNHHCVRFPLDFSAYKACTSDFR